jgi:excisionase family DNA binding protein
VHELVTPRNVQDLPLTLTVDEAAEVLRIGKNTAYAAVADGSLPSVRIGRVIRIPRDALAAVLGADAGAAEGAGDN